MTAVSTHSRTLPNVLHNETQTANHWLGMTLVGHKSNRDAIGAEVKVQTEHGSQLGIVTTTSSYLSSGDKRLHFGLGTDELAESIEIRWPAGIIQKLQNVHGDRMMQIEEPAANESPDSSTNSKRR